MATPTPAHASKGITTRPILIQSGQIRVSSLFAVRSSPSGCEAASFHCLYSDTTWCFCIDSVLGSFFLLLDPGGI